MPELNGIEATRELAPAVPTTAVLVLTMFDEDDSVFAAMRAGARGYVLKGAEQQEIARAIMAVAAGEAIFGPAVATRVLAYFATPPATPTPFPERPPANARSWTCRRPQQPPDRRTAQPQRQDGRQPHLRHLRQAPGGRPHPSHPARPRRRLGPPLTQLDGTDRPAETSCGNHGSYALNHRCAGLRRCWPSSARAPPRLSPPRCPHRRAAGAQYGDSSRRTGTALMAPQEVMSVMRCHPVHGRRACSVHTVSSVSAGSGPGRT